MSRLPDTPFKALKFVAVIPPPIMPPAATRRTVPVGSTSELGVSAPLELRLMSPPAADTMLVAPSEMLGDVADMPVPTVKLPPAAERELLIATDPTLALTPFQMLTEPKEYVPE